MKCVFSSLRWTWNSTKSFTVSPTPILIVTALVKSLAKAISATRLNCHSKDAEQSRILNVFSPTTLSFDSTLDWKWMAMKLSQLCAVIHHRLPHHPRFYRQVLQSRLLTSFIVHFNTANDLTSFWTFMIFFQARSYFASSSCTFARNPNSFHYLRPNVPHSHVAGSRGFLLLPSQ